MLATCLSTASVNGWAQGSEAPPAIGSCAPCTKVDDSRLDSLRGGFDNGMGLRAAFGLERSVSINGQLVSSQRIHIADLSRISAAQARELQAVLGSVTLVQNGARNQVALPADLGAGTTVIQNSLNDQTIRSSTVLNASSNSLQLLRSISTGTALNDALVAPLTPR
jgi:hypothetical protein